MRRPFSPLQRWPLLLASAPLVHGRRRHRVLATCFGTAVVVASVVVGAHVPFAAQVLLGIGGLATILGALLQRPSVAPPSSTYVEAHPEGLSRITHDASKSIVTWDAPFGVALLASYGRPTALLAFMTPTQTRYVPARIDDRSEDDDALLARIAVLADLDLVDGIAHDAALSSAATAALVRHVEERDRDALGRIFLSDGNGLPIALDRATLAIGGRSFDLTSQLEWRPLVFHESTGRSSALYQATWIKQAGAEIVLVAPMPASILPREANAHREASGHLGRALTRDLQLLQAPAESPPAREVRIAIDRPFMIAIRRVLDDAPRAARVRPEAPLPRQKLTAHS